MLQKNSADRPPATFAAQKEWMQKNRDAGRKSDFVAATTLAQAVKEPNVTGFKMHNISQQNREEMLKQAQALNKFSKERLDAEKQNSSIGMAGGVASGRGTAGSKPTQTLKLPTLGAMQNKGSGAGQTLSQQTGQRGEAGAGRAGGKFNKPLTGVAGPDQQSGLTGKPTLGDKGDKDTQAADQDKSFKPGRPFGLNKAADQDKASEQNPTRNPWGTRPGQLAQPSDGQNKSTDQDKATEQNTPRKTFGGRSGQGAGVSDKAQGGSGKPNMTLMPQGSGSGGGGAQGSAGKSNVMVPTQGQAGGGGSQLGNVKTFNPQGGGVQQRMTPSNPPAKKDKGDDDQQQQQRKGNRSDTTSPRTNFSMERGDNSLPLNVGGVATAEKEAMRRDISPRTDNWAKQALNDKLTNDKTPTALPRTAVAKPQSNNPNGSPAPGDNSVSKAPGPTEQPNPQGYSTAPGSGRSAPGSMSTYRSLMQRGALSASRARAVKPPQRMTWIRAWMRG